MGVPITMKSRSLLTQILVVNLLLIVAAVLLAAVAVSPSLLRRTPVTGSAYGSSGTYGRRYRATVLRYSSAALISPST